MYGIFIIKVYEKKKFRHIYFSLDYLVHLRYFTRGVINELFRTPKQETFFEKFKIKFPFLFLFIILLLHILTFLCYFRFL